jgi:hypothetical protein
MKNEISEVPTIRATNTLPHNLWCREPLRLKKIAQVPIKKSEQHGHNVHLDGERRLD